MAEDNAWFTAHRDTRHPGGVQHPAIPLESYKVLTLRTTRTGAHCRTSQTVGWIVPPARSTPALVDIVKHCSLENRDQPRMLPGSIVLVTSCIAKKGRCFVFATRSSDRWPSRVNDSRFIEYRCPAAAYGLQCAGRETSTGRLRKLDYGPRRIDIAGPAYLYAPYDESFLAPWQQCAGTDNSLQQTAAQCN